MFAELCSRLSNQNALRLRRERTSKLNQWKRRRMYPAIKRVIDLLGAILTLVVLGLPMAIVAVLVRICMGSPVLHRAVRPGLRARTFVLYKFRTMTEGVDSRGRRLPDKQRITPLGRFLRKTSLDELPQLFNVLKGEMSLVGPRPLLVEYLKLYSAEQARRHDVKPGITGLAQINGRNTLSWDQRFALDLWYLDHASVALDLRILLRTAAIVIMRRSLGPDGDLDVPSFRGGAAIVAQDSSLYAASPDSLSAASTQGFQGKSFT